VLEERLASHEVHLKQHPVGMPVEFGVTLEKGGRLYDRLAKKLRTND
jgi:hypothetical protein